LRAINKEDGVDSGRAKRNDTTVIAIGLRLVLLGAVLVQYTPMRLCALERAAFGTNCHDQAKSNLDDHGDERTCGTGAGRDTGCVCEHPKLVGDQQLISHAAVDLTGHAVVAEVVEAPVIVTIVAARDPDPQRDLLASLQLPLLI